MTALRILILDDEQERVNLFEAFFKSGVGGPFKSLDVCHVPSAKACINQLAERKWHAVFLDHDLEGSALEYGIIDHGDGRDVTDWIYAQARDGITFGATHFIVHSLNREHARTMIANLEEAGACHSRRAYAWFDRHVLQTFARTGEWDHSSERWDTHFPALPPVRLTKDQRHAMIYGPKKLGF
jgi:CheY-like chemotaxis protein